MTMIKKLPLTMAVIAAFFPLTSVMAQEFTQEQIDAIVAKAVDKALADRQAKIDAAANKKVDVITNPETTAASPDMAIPFGLKFSGYARYGAHFQTGDQKYVGVDGSYNGASAIGRLGNESNGGEFQISKAFKSAQGAIWDLNVMFDHWSDEVNLKKAYVGVTNVLESNPNAYIWAGRDFHQRPQQGINDYFWMNHDGQGAGVKNFDIGGVQFDVAAVSQVKSCSPEVMADETNPSRITCTGRVFCCVVSNVKKSNVVRYWLSRAPSTRTPSSNLKCTSCPKTKAAVILRSSKATVRSSTSVLLT